MNELEYWYNNYIKGNKTLLKNIEEDEFHNLIVHTYEDLSITREREQAKIIGLYEQAIKDNKTVIQSFKWVKNEMLSDRDMFDYYQVYLKNQFTTADTEKNFNDLIEHFDLDKGLILNTLMDTFVTGMRRPGSCERGTLQDIFFQGELHPKGLGEE